MQKLIFMCGIPGSGKSTYARKLTMFGYNRVNMDEIRIEYPHLPKARQWGISFDRVLTFSNLGKSVVIDNTNFLAEQRRRYMRVKVPSKICIWLDTPLEVCLLRNSLRTGSARVPENVIRDMYLKFQEPSTIEGFTTIRRISWVAEHCSAALRNSDTG